MSSRTATVLLMGPLLAAGCELGPPIAEPVGVPTRVDLLGEGFVRFEGQRIAVEFFLLEMRERVRAAHGDAEQMPRINLYVPAGWKAEDGRRVSRLREELEKAGIRFFAVAFATEGA